MIKAIEYLENTSNIIVEVQQTAINKSIPKEKIISQGWKITDWHYPTYTTRQTNHQNVSQLILRENIKILSSLPPQ